MMFKKALLLFSLLILLTGCVERGFKLTVNKETKTITAVKSIDIRKETKASTAKDIDKMSRAVSKAQKTQIKNPTTIKSMPIAQVQQIEKDNTKKAMEKAKYIAKQKEALAEQKRIAQKKEMEQRQAALDAKLAKEEEAQKFAAQKERMRLQEEAEAKKIAQEEKEKALEVIKEEKQRKAAAKKLAMEKAAQEKKEQEDKAALEYKITKEKAMRVKKEKEQRAALALKIAKEKQIAFEKQKAEKLKLAEERKAELIRKRAAEEKLRLEKEIAARKAKAEEKKVVKTAETLNFKPSTQTYQKFGTSEIHGHVVYLTPSGQEISLNNTKIYLVPKNTKTDYWYNNYYLKNKESNSISKSTVHYINATHLNMESNFAFYGLPKGTYYVIIESSYPSSIAKNKKVYIAKKIDVEKYKKIMTVFSKRL